MILFCALVRPLGADERGALHHEEFIVLFDTPLQTAAREVSQIYPSLKSELEGTFSWKLSSKPTILLLRNNEIFPKAIRSDSVVAFAIPPQDLIVIDYSRMNVRPFTLEATLKHELCHLLLHDSIPQPNLPRWLDEGVCQWISDGIAEIIMEGSSSVLNEAVLAGRTIRLDDLEEDFPRERMPLILAYEQSKNFVKHIIRRFGRDKLLEILIHLKEGRKIEAAVQKSLLVSLEDLEKEWHESLQRRMTWFTYVSLHLYEILFFLAALITIVYGFIRILLKRKAYRDEEDDDGEELRLL